MGLDPLPREQLHRVIGPPLRHSAPDVLAERGRDGPEDLDEFLDGFRTAIHELEDAGAALVVDTPGQLAEALGV